MLQLPPTVIVMLVVVVKAVVIVVDVIVIVTLTMAAAIAILTAMFVLVVKLNTTYHCLEGILIPSQTTILLLPILINVNATV